MANAQYHIADNISKWVSFNYSTKNSCFAKGIRMIKNYTHNQKDNNS